jgi:excisionase family DNA binding protein
MHDPKRDQADGTLPALAGSAGDVLLPDNHFDDFHSPLLTVPEAARFLRISPTGMRRLQQERRVPFIKVGGAVRFLREDLLAYLRKQRVEAIG